MAGESSGALGKPACRAGEFRSADQFGHRAGQADREFGKTSSGRQREPAINRAAEEIDGADEGRRARAGGEGCGGAGGLDGRDAAPDFERDRYRVERGGAGQKQGAEGVEELGGTRLRQGRRGGTKVEAGHVGIVDGKRAAAGERRGQGGRAEPFPRDGGDGGKFARLEVQRAAEQGPVQHDTIRLAAQRKMGEIAGLEPGGPRDGRATEAGRHIVDHHGAVLGDGVEREGGDGRRQADQDTVGIDMELGRVATERRERQRILRAGVDGGQGQGLGLDPALNRAAHDGELATGPHGAGDEFEPGQLQAAWRFGELGNQGKGTVTQPGCGAGITELVEQAGGTRVMKGQRSGPAAGRQVEDRLPLGTEVAEFGIAAQGERVRRSGGGKQQVGGPADQAREGGVLDGQKGAQGADLARREFEAALGQSARIAERTGSGDLEPGERGFQTTNGEMAGLALNVEGERPEAGAAPLGPLDVEFEIAVETDCGQRFDGGGVGGGRVVEDGTVGKKRVEQEAVEREAEADRRPGAEAEHEAALQRAVVQRALQVGQRDLGRVGGELAGEICGVEGAGWKGADDGGGRRARAS